MILENIDYDILAGDPHVDREQLDEIVDLVQETVCSIHIHPAGTVNAADGTGFCFFPGFTDVSEKVTYAESVSYLANAGILRGTASGRFAPNEKITVSQWATMLCRAFDTEPEGVSWQEVGANAVQIAIRSGWLEPTAISDANGLICRGELYRTAFAAAGIPLYDATLYGLDWLSPSENTLRVGKELGLCAENKTAAELVTRAEAAQLLHAVLTQTLTVTPPDTPIVVENLTQWNVNAFLLELCKVPQPILDAFNENGWTFVIGTEYLTNLSRKLGVNCIGAAVYTEKRIYVSEASAVLHEFGHFLDCAMGFPQEHKDLYALEAASAPMKQHAKSNSLEYFAEFFAYWLSGSTRTLAQLKELTPETYVCRDLRRFRHFAHLSAVFRYTLGTQCVMGVQSVRAKARRKLMQLSLRLAFYIRIELRRNVTVKPNRA